MDSKQIVELPYDQRRMIVVQDAEAADKAVRGIRLGTLLAGGVLGGIVVIAAVEAMRIFMARSSIDGQVLTVTTSEAAGLRFPIGHPRRKVVYVGHPVDPAMYIPMAHFHTFLFEHKVAEALRLIRSLGAESVDVVRMEGWDSSVGITLAAPIPAAQQVEVGASVGVERGQGHYIMSRMRLTPAGTPKVPNNLVWLHHEPLWQEIVDARLNSGLRSFVLDVRSFDDYGVNAGLKVLVAKSGLDVGGSFVEHRSTLWRLEGTFLG